MQLMKEQGQKNLEEEQRKNATRPRYQQAEPKQHQSGPLMIGLAIAARHTLSSHSSSIGFTRGSTSASSSYSTARSQLTPNLFSLQTMSSKANQVGRKSSTNTESSYHTAQQFQFN